MLFWNVSLILCKKQSTNLIIFFIKYFFIFSHPIFPLIWTCQIPTHYTTLLCETNIISKVHLSKMMLHIQWQRTSLSIPICTHVLTDNDWLASLSVLYHTHHLDSNSQSPDESRNAFLMHHSEPAVWQFFSWLVTSFDYFYLSHYVYLYQYFIMNKVFYPLWYI